MCIRDSGNSIQSGLRSFGTDKSPFATSRPVVPGPVPAKAPPSSRAFAPPAVNANFAQTNKPKPPVTNNFADTARKAFPNTKFGGQDDSGTSPRANANFNTPNRLAPITPNRSVSTNRAKSGSDFGGQVFEDQPRARTNTQSAFSQRKPAGAAFPPARATIPAQSVSSNISNRPSSRLGASIGNSATSSMTKNLPGERQYEGVQAPALTVEKIAPREIQVQQPADFQLVIKNVGRAGAEQVQVFDQIPNGTQFLSSSPEPSSNAGGNVRWDLGKLRPGQEKRIKIKLKPIRHGEIGSVAHVAFSTKASMRTLVTKPVLDIVHQSKQIHLIGDDVVFDITVKNKGDGPATNVMIQEDVPQQLEFQDGSPGIEYEIGTLLPGQSRRVQLSLKAAKIGKLRNVMFASADGGLQARHELPMEVVAPNLITRSNGPKIRFLKRNATHNFSIANNGTAAATNVELIARLPSGLRFVNANNQGRYDANAHSVFWSLAELGRDAKADVELKTSPVEVGSQPIKFETFADLEVRSSVVQPLTVQHLVDVFFDIDDVVDPIEVGSETSYRVRVVNQGTKNATNVRIQVDFPRGLQPIAIDGSLKHQIAGQRTIFDPINSMSPGDEISCIIRGKGQSEGDHRIVVNMQTDGRQTPVSKEETTRVYSDR